MLKDVIVEDMVNEVTDDRCFGFDTLPLTILCVMYSRLNRYVTLLLAIIMHTLFPFCFTYIVYVFSLLIKTVFLSINPC